MKKRLKLRVLVAALSVATALSGCGGSGGSNFSNFSPVTVQEETEVIGGPTPVANPDAFSVLGNASFEQDADSGVLSNDVLNGAAISAFDERGSRGGTLGLEQNGSFRYTPAPNFVGEESFTYTLANEDGTSTATVTFTSTALGRFVDNSAPDNGLGSQDDPFNNIASAIAAARSGDTIFVSRGNGTNSGMTGGFTLPAGVDLIGQGTGFVLAQTILPQGEAPTLEGPIVCAGDNLIQGITIDGSTSDLVVVDGVGNVTIQDSTLSNPTENHIAVANVSGTFSVLNNTLDSPPDDSEDYISVENESTDATINVSDNTFRNDSNQDVRALLAVSPAGTSRLDTTFKGNDALGTSTKQFNYGFYITNTGTGACTVNIDDNTLNSFNQDTDSYPIGVFAFPGPISGSITQNRTSNSGFAGAYVGAVDGDILRVSGNTFDTAEYGLFSDFSGDGTLIVDEENTITNSTNVGIYVQTNGEDVRGKVAVRDNTLSSNNESFYGFTPGDRSSLCIDMTGNTIDSDVIFEARATDTTIDVERRDGGADGGPLSTVNSFSLDVMVRTVAGDGTVNSVPAGSCQIP